MSNHNDQYLPAQPKGLKVHRSRVVATPGARALMTKTGIEPMSFISRHLNSDWGQSCTEDAEANDQAVANGSRTLASYDCGGTKLWVIVDQALSDDEATDYDGHRFAPGERCAMTLLLPEEY